MKPILMRMGCVGMLLLAAGIVDGAGSRPYSSQAFWPLLLLAMGIAVGGMGLGVRAELLGNDGAFCEMENRTPGRCMKCQMNFLTAAVPEMGNCS